MDSSGNVAAPLAGLREAFPTILSSYYDTQQRPIQNCVIVVDRNGGWNLIENRLEAVRWASSLLFLAAWATNEYFTPIRSYVSDTSFQVYFQRFSEPVDFISLGYRQRDGNVLYGGPRHGEIHFTMPLQCSSEFNVEMEFLAALNAAYSAGSNVTGRLKAVLPLIRLANTDNDVMTLDAEAALMGFVFEQYFEANKARDLAAKFEALFGGYFHTSAVAHGEWRASRTWGWSPFEHLVMAAFVFPLVVKLGLAHEGHYALSRDDDIRCRAIDGLLSLPKWAGEAGSMQSPWQNVIQGKKSEVRIAAAVKKGRGGSEGSRNRTSMRAGRLKKAALGSVSVLAREVNRVIGEPQRHLVEREVGVFDFPREHDVVISVLATERSRPVAPDHEFPDLELFWRDCPAGVRCLNLLDIGGCRPKMKIIAGDAK